MKNFLSILLLLPLFLHSQTYIAAPYKDSFDSPIKVDSGTVAKINCNGWFINEKRYEFYKKLHSFAASEKMKGKESEIIAGFGGFLTQYEAIAKDLTDTSTKLDSSAERLKTAQDALNKLEVQVYELGRTNEELRRKLELKPTNQKGKWVVPLFVGATVGVILGVVIN